MKLMMNDFGISKSYFGISSWFWNDIQVSNVLLHVGEVLAFFWTGLLWSFLLSANLFCISCGLWDLPGSANLSKM